VVGDLKVAAEPQDGHSPENYQSRLLTPMRRIAFADCAPGDSWTFSKFHPSRAVLLLRLSHPNAQHGIGWSFD
jgi:hypothetical protein